MSASTKWADVEEKTDLKEKVAPLPAAEVGHSFLCCTLSLAHTHLLFFEQMKENKEGEHTIVEYYYNEKGQKVRVTRVVRVMIILSFLVSIVFLTHKRNCRRSRKQLK